MLVLGLAGEDDYSAAPVVHRIKDIKLGFLGYSFVRENYYGGRPLYALGDLGNVINDIKRLKREVDFVVVSCHWGLEIINRPSLHTIEMARAMIDHGADVIFGHHPHVFQAIERYKSGLIFYSLGNFVFDCLWEKEYVRSAIVKVTLQRGEKISYDLIPIRINSGYQPVPLTGSDEKAFLSYVSDISNKDYYDNYQDLEESCLNYYVEYNRCEKSAVYKKILFLMRRLHKVKFSVLAMVFWEKFLKKVLPL
ncbi:MAG: CapA family protein [Candidatus Manganitrophus sp.]|nr:MAG: CapA family protein [Candidatus Manganitrophus sp.]